MESLEVAEDVMGEVSIEEITESIPKAVRAVDFGSAGWRNRWVKKTTEHLEAAKKLRGKFGKEPKKGESNEPQESFNHCRRGEARTKCV